MEEVINNLKKVSQGDIPAPGTLAFMDEQRKFNQRMELSTNDMKHNIESICENLRQHTVDQKEQFATLNKKLDDFIGVADTRYAEKKVEDIVGKVLWAFGFLIVGAIAAAVFKLIFK